MAKQFYTAEDLASRIKELRKAKEILTDREGELIMLHSAAVEYNCPVDDNGRPWGKAKKVASRVKKGLLPVAEFLAKIREKAGV